MKYYFIAGERSGDLHAGNLARQLFLLDPNAEMRALGGQYLETAGAAIDINYQEIAVMGFWEVITNLRKINRYLDRCKNKILAFNPDVIILVDFGGFNKRIAAWAKKQHIKVYYYISPKVWAWNEGRALKLKAVVDKMFVILPFETDFYKKYDWDVDYVGNPVLDAVKAHSASPGFHAKYNLSSTPLIALLPGSRKQEIKNMLDLMVTVASNFPKYNFGIAAVSTLDKALYADIEKCPNVVLIFEDTYDLLSHSAAAIVTSGTATLETALLRVPQVVVYRTSFVSYHIARAVIRVPFISLVNLVAGREVVRELMQHDLTVSNLSAELQAIVDGPRREKMLKDYQEIYTRLDTGSASENTARLMFKYLTE